MRRTLLALPLLTAALVSCSEPVTDPTAGPDAPRAGATKFWETGASVYWNGVARDLVVKHRFSAFQAMRGYAAVSVAQYNAVIAAENGSARGTHPSPGAAVASASVVALSYLFPTEADSLEGLAAERRTGPGWPGERHTDVTAGERIGREVGELVVARTHADRFFAPWTGTVPTGPGLWFSPTPPVGALFGRAETYFLLSGDQFRPPPPPAFGSPEFLAALAEVRRISDTRTPEQTAIAQFWALPAGTHTPPGYWNEQAATLAVRYRLGERQAAHLFALMNMTGFDAIVASHDAKFHYWCLRPTQADAAITLAVGLPNFPSYPSNHASLSGGMARILGAVFPSERKRLEALAEEAALSRLYGGIHFRFDNDTGLRLGRAIAGWALEHDVVGHEPFLLR